MTNTYTRSRKPAMVIGAVVSGLFLLLYLLNTYFYGRFDRWDLFISRTVMNSVGGVVGIFVYALLAFELVRFLSARGLRRSDWMRWIIELAFVLIAALLISQLNMRSHPPLDAHRDMHTPLHPFAFNYFIFFLGGAIIMAITETWHAFEANRALQLSLVAAEKEKTASQLIALQQKVNPHFLFNSLSVLSELIYIDTDKADAFIREFSKVYRYVLDFKDQTVVTVAEELEFLEAYLFLQKIRFGENLQTSITIADKALQEHIPPLSLQLLLENAIKHNSISKAAPLAISIESHPTHLVVQNRLQTRQEVKNSKGVGLFHLQKTYELISSQRLEICKSAEFFKVVLPFVTLAKK